MFKEVPYYLMILTNLTTSEKGQQKFLNIENEKIKGIVLMKILDKFFMYIQNDEFDFCSNLLANISSLKEGRQMMIEYKVYKIFLVQYDKLNNFKMLNILRALRNCCFEHETNEEDILVSDVYMFI